MTTSNPTPSLSSSSSSPRSRPVAFAVSSAPSADAVARRSSSMSIATTRPPRLRDVEAPATMNEPMPPAPITANGVVRALRRLATARAGRRRVAAPSRPRRRRMARGRGGRSPRARSRLRKPAVDLEAERAVLGAQVRATGAAPATVATRDPGPRDDAVADPEAVTSSPSATTRPTNSCPRTTPGRQRTGP